MVPKIVVGEGLCVASWEEGHGASSEEEEEGDHASFA